MILGKAAHSDARTMFAAIGRGFGAMKREIVLPVLIVLAAVTPIVVAALVPNPVTFNIVAQTEQLTVTVSDQIAWYLDGFDIFFLDEKREQQILSGFSGSFVPTPGARATITRRSTGPLELRINSPATGGKGPGIARDNEGKELALPKQISLIFVNSNVRANARKGDTIYLPIGGRAEFGSKSARPTVANAPILRSATVSLLARAPLAGDLFNGGTYPLDTGDQFEVTGTDGNGQGFVMANENPAFLAVFRVVGAKGTVARSGGQGYDISVSVWQLLSNDPLVRNVWIAIGSVVAFLQLIWPAIKRKRQEHDDIT
jgi:hypothetical protein